MPANAAVPTIPLSDDAYWQDPYPVLAAVRDQSRTAVTDEGLQAVLRFEDCEALLKSPDFVNEGLEYIERRGFQAGDPLYEWRRHSIGALNGPDHDRIRSLVSRGITHRSVDALRPKIRAHARRLLQNVSANRSMETIGDFATRLPFLTIADFLGIELTEAVEMAQQMRSGAVDAFGPRVTPEIRAKANETFAAMMKFVAGLYEERRDEPRGDILTDLIRAEVAGDRLSHEELVVLFTNIFGGAIETTASVISSGVLEMARHPGEAHRLREDPERWKRGAAEEVIRMRPGFYAIGKKAARDIRAFGTRFKQNEPLTILIGAPNRDPARWKNPDAFDIGRDPRLWSLSFSMGDHFCLGQALARCEVQEAIAAVVHHCHDLEIQEEPRWKSQVMVNRMEELRVSFEPHDL